MRKLFFRRGRSVTGAIWAHWEPKNGGLPLGCALNQPSQKGHDPSRPGSEPSKNQVYLGVAEKSNSWGYTGLSLWFHFRPHVLSHSQFEPARPALKVFRLGAAGAPGKAGPQPAAATTSPVPRHATPGRSGNSPPPFRWRQNWV